MPRKTRPRAGTRAASLSASMRPRPDATENARVRRHRYRAELASMRPRPDATENPGKERGLVLDFVGLQ